MDVEHTKWQARPVWRMLPGGAPASIS